MARPRRPEDEAREFGRLVEREHNGSENLEAVFMRVRRRDALRWGSRAKMWRLWEEFKRLPFAATLPPRVSRDERRVIDLRERCAKLEQEAAEFAASVRRIVTRQRAASRRPAK